MGLDVYVGSLTRYYCRDWETVVQQWARDQGHEFHEVRPPEASDAITDPDTVREAVLTWRNGLSNALAKHHVQPLDWSEDDGTPYFTDRPAWDSYSALLLWASYDENPDLELPSRAPNDWASDPAFQRSSSQGFNTHYPSLLRAEIWLPSQSPFVFQAQDVAGNDVLFGSAPLLLKELELLNSRTWSVDSVILAKWRQSGCESGSPIEPAAQFGLSVFLPLARKAVDNRLVMKLDY